MSSPAIRNLSTGARADEAFERAASFIASLTGWRRAFAGFAAGLVTALAFAPFYLVPLLAVGFSALIFLLDGALKSPHPRRAAFATGWYFGFGYFLLSVYWMAFSFFVQAEQFAWMSPFAVLGMPAFLALFSGSAAFVASRFWREGPARVLFFAVVWMTFEYARGHILTGLPWNLPGQALAGAAMGAQTAAWWGVYGLSLIVILLAAAPAAFAGRGRAIKGLGACLGGALALYAIGAARLALLDPGVYEDVSVRIIQPNIPQREKIDSDFWARNFWRQVNLSKGEATGAAASGELYILWPENAVSLIDEYSDALQVLSDELPKNAVLLTGAVRREAAGPRDIYFNSILAIAPGPDPSRAVIGHYDKHHLVPFGEYLPMEGFLRAVGLAQLAPYDEGFEMGKGPSVLRAGAGPAFAPLICYEAIFPGEIYPKDDRPDWIVTVTNDAWFGDTSGPRQHLDQAKLRSIETGLPMARSANTGVSVLIDARGRVLDRVALYKEGRIDAALPKPLPPTLYARIGDVLFLLLSMVAFFAGFTYKYRREQA